jgi:hypothetical protein
MLLPACRDVEAAHLLELIGCRRTVRGTHDRGAYTAMPDEQRDIRSKASLTQPRALDGKIDVPAAIRVRDDGRDALGKKRLPLTQLLTQKSFGGV